MDLVRVEEVLEHEAALVIIQRIRRLGSQGEERVHGGAFHVIAELVDERRHHVEGLMDARKLLQQLHHAVVVFEPVHADPGQAVVAGHQVLVVRLMHMPKKDDPDHRHLFSVNTPSPSGSFLPQMPAPWL